MGISDFAALTRCFICPPSEREALGLWEWHRRHYLRPGLSPEDQVNKGTEGRDRRFINKMFPEGGMEQNHDGFHMVQGKARD